MSHVSAVSRVSPGSRLTGSALAAALLLAACGSSGPTPGAGSLVPGRNPSAPPGSAATSAPSSSGTSQAAGAATPAASIGPAPSVRLEPVASVSQALAIANAHDGSGRLFVAAQSGQVWVITAGRRSDKPILDISGRITSGGERGLLGIAFHPRFPADRRLFVDYTDRDGNTVVASFRVGPADPPGSAGPLTVDPASERVILQVNQPYPNHNGGGLAFGPDGDLYIALGDGGSAGDPQGNGQRLDTLLGKILRIDVDGSSGQNAYAIPSGNPFVGRTGARPEIWLLGLRNPWRYSFDRATADLWIGDVGQNLWEEIDVVPAGANGLNFGWNRMEGFHCYPSGDGCATTGLMLPVAEYGHGATCSVVGGYVYRGTAYTSLVGRYLFADYCSGDIFAINAATTGRQEPQRVGKTSSGVAAFGEDEGGELYVANVSDGSVGRITVAP